MKQKYYWKVVDKFEGKFVSACSGGKYRLNYKIGGTTTPKIGKVFVFNTRKTARDWKGYIGDWKILKVTAKNPKVPKINYPEKYKRNTIKKSWKTYNKLGYFNLFHSFPEGTVFADSVTPIEISH